MLVHFNAIQIAITYQWYEFLHYFLLNIELAYQIYWLPINCWIYCSERYKWYTALWLAKRCTRMKSDLRLLNDLLWIYEKRKKLISLASLRREHSCEDLAGPHAIYPRQKHIATTQVLTVDQGTSTPCEVQPFDSAFNRITIAFSEIPFKIYLSSF